MIILALQISLMIFGIHAASQPSMILSFLRNGSKDPSWVTKPLFDCVICMSSFWTIIVWFLSGGKLSIWLLQLILIVAGINYIIAALLGFLNESSFFKE